MQVLRRIASLDEKQIDGLVEQLNRGVIRSIPGLSKAVRQAAGDSWDEQQSEAFASHLLSLSILAVGSDFSVTELSTRVAEQISDLDAKAEEVLPKRLASLLSSKDLAALGKAVDLARESNRLLNDARIVSELRPVFGEDMTAEPPGAVILHTLRLNYMEEGERKTMSLTLNSRDLIQVKRAVERAQIKQNTLSRLLNRADLIEFQLTEGETDD
jgi:hypothetical protein